MTKAGSVAEMPIAPVDASARRLGGAKGGNSGERAERDPFPELLSRLADGGAGQARKPMMRAEAGDTAEADRVVSTRWRHVGRVAPFDQDAPPAEGQVETTALELPRAVDSAAVSKVLAGEPLPVMPQPIPQGPTTDAREATDAPSEAPGEGEAGTRLPDVAALKAQLSAKGAPAANTGIDVEAKVAVLRSETHFAPVVLSSLLSRAVDRPAAAPATGKPAQGLAVAAEALEMDAPGDRVATGLGGDKLEHPVKAVPAGKDRGDGADMFGRSRNGRALPAADGAAGERGAGGTATGAELRATSAGFVPQPAGPVASPVQQIADRIAAEVTAAGGSARRASPAGSAGQPASTQVKVLHIELQPADLGTIEVRISLKHDALELKLEASRAESAALISRDKDALAGMLRSAGYLIDGLTVQIADADRNALTSQSGGTHTPPQSSTQGQSGSSNPDAQSDRAGRQPEHDNRSNSATRDDNGSEQRSQRPDGALYV